MTEVLEHKKKIATLFIIVNMAVVALLAACDAGHPEVLADGREIMLALHLSLPKTENGSHTRAVTSNEENAIDLNQLKVLVFKDNGGSETFCYEAPQVQLQGTEYMVTLKQSQEGEKYRLVVIANAGRKLPFIPENTTKGDALKMLTFNATGKWNATSNADYALFPMWGETAAAQVIAPTTRYVSVTLLRALARIDVGCAVSGETTAVISGFTLKSVSVYRTRNKGYVAPVNGGVINSNVVTSVSIPPDAGNNSALTYTCTDGKSLIRTIYIAEAAQGTNRDNNVCLVIGGTYKGTTNYYRVDLTSGGSYIPIKRNCRYIVNIRAVTNAGYGNEVDALEGKKTLLVATSILEEAWGGETTAGSGTITLP